MRKHAKRSFKQSVTKMEAGQRPTELLPRFSSCGVINTSFPLFRREHGAWRKHGAVKGSHES